TLGGFETFTIEADPVGEELCEPLLVLHGFPSCSYDYRRVLSGLAANRTVLLLDFVGFGLSEKPDIRYSIEMHADVVMEYISEIGVGQIALLTHDMGDSVGGELLARSSEGRWNIEITRRVVTNGSIYLELAHLTDGQQLLLSLPDAALESGPDEAALAGALAATMAERSLDARSDLNGDAQLICMSRGNALLPRTIRYIEDRRRSENRYTGAIESHSSPLAIVWGTEDPIAVTEMAKRLSDKVPDATLDLLSGVGHYPMLEAPELFLSAVGRALAAS
ncbi:MAG: alpha/beta hydrolase, partial [Acidimicrobiales bacterium]